MKARDIKVGAIYEVGPGCHYYYWRFPSHSRGRSKSFDALPAPENCNTIDLTGIKMRCIAKTSAGGFSRGTIKSTFIVLKSLSPGRGWAVGRCIKPNDLIIAAHHAGIKLLRDEPPKLSRRQLKANAIEQEIKKIESQVNANTSKIDSLNSRNLLCTKEIQNLTETLEKLKKFESDEDEIAYDLYTLLTNGQTPSVNDIAGILKTYTKLLQDEK